MKKENRTELFCIKKIPSGHIDSFRVIVSTNEESEYRKMYQSMGYEVSKN